MSKQKVYNNWTGLFNYKRPVKVLPVPVTGKCNDATIKASAVHILRCLSFIA